MPISVYQNPSVLETITRPVVLDISRQVLDMTGLPKDLPIQYPGDSGTMYQPGSTITTPGEFNNFTSRPQLFLRAEENRPTDRVLSTAITYPDAPIIFADEPTQVYCRAIYFPIELNISISYRASDRDAAIRWRNEIQSRISMNRDVILHQISYSYLFSQDMMDCLTKIQSMQEAVAPYNRSLDDYFEACFDSRASKMVTLAGTAPTWGMAETQGRVQGYFDFESEPEEGERVEGNAAWTIQFTYKVRYDKPIGTVMNYPLMVHNQLVPDTMLPQSITPDQHVQTSYSQSVANFEHFSVSRRNAAQGYRSMGYAIPEFDDFIPDQMSIPVFTARIATMLTSIDTSVGGNPALLLDLKDLGPGRSINPVIRNFMLGEVPYLTAVGGSILNVAVYQGNILMNVNHYHVDNQLNVILDVEPDLRSVYHVRLGIYTQPYAMPSQAQDRLRKNCQAAFLLLPALCPELLEKNILTTCLSNNTVPMVDFSNAMNYMNLGARYTDFGNYYQFNTVMLFGLVAERGD